MNLVQNKKNQNLIHNAGYSAVELMLAVAIFTIMISGAVLLMIYVLDSSNRATINTQAVLLSFEGLEIIKNYAETDYVGLYDKVDLEGGEFVGKITSTGNPPVWGIVEGDPEEIVFLYNNGSSINFERQIKITEFNSSANATSSKMFVESIVSWSNNKYEINLNTVITSWRE